MSTATTKPLSVNQPADVGEAFARYYDLDVVDETADVALYLALASAADGPVLELACGTGRVAIALARAGKDVTGVDRDPHMLQRARSGWRAVAEDTARSAGSLELVEADITELRLGRRFDLVILAFNSLLLLAGSGQRQAALESMRNHLSATGRAVIDVWLPRADDLELYDGRVITDWARYDPELGERVTKKTVATYDAATRRAQIETIYESPAERAAPRWIKRTDVIEFVTVEQLLAELESAGLQPQSMLGDYDGTEFSSQSDRLIVLAAPYSARRRHSRTTRPSPVTLL